MKTKHAATSTINQAQVVIGVVTAINLVNSLRAGDDLVLTVDGALSIVALVGVLFTIIRRTIKEHKKCHF